jgi:cysteine synthase A
MTLQFAIHGHATREVIRDGFQDALPEVLTVKPRLHLLAFQTMKLLPALGVINDLEQRGLLQPGGIAADTTSGSWGYGVARVCAVKKFRCILVSDKAMNGDFLGGVEAHGAEVIVVDAPVDGANLQVIRKQRLNEVAAATGAVVLDQYDNLVAAEAYRAAAEIATGHVPRIDALVAPIGSGSSSRGLTHYLRSVNPGLRLIAVDTFASALFGLRVGPRLLRGVGSSLVPGNVHHQAIDDVHFVSADVAHEGVLRIAEAGLGDYGPTSGAAFMVANAVSLAMPDATVMCIFPDRQFRYVDLIAAHRAWRATLLHGMPAAPIWVTHLAHVVEARGWVAFNWRRRTRDEVLALEGATP